MSGRVRRLAPLVLSVVFVLVAGVVVWNASTTGPGGGGAACTSRTPLVVASSTEKSALVESMVARYDRQPGRCADATVVGVPSGIAVDVLAHGWDDSLGPRPDVWTPSSSVWLGVANRRRTTEPAPPGTTGPPPAIPTDVDPSRSIAQNRVVLAVPESVARARFGWPRATLGWPDLAGAVSSGSFTLGKTNPALSTPGLFALLGAFASTPGVPGALDRPELMDDPRALDLEQRIESGVVHYGNTEQEFLRNMADAAVKRGSPSAYVGAIAVQEKAVWDYNRGNPEADVPAPVGATAPAEQLVSFVPRDGTFVSDNPWVTLGWPETSAETRAAADDLRSWFGEPAQQDELRANGFRGSDGSADPALERTTHPAEEGGPTLPVPSAEVVTRAVDLWSTRLRKPANLTLAVDTSGSMACEASWIPPVAPARQEACPKDGQSRLEAVQQQAAGALARLRPGDTLGVWTFSSGSPPYRPAPPTTVGPPGSGNTPADIVARAFPPDFVPTGNTAIYRTARDAITQIRSTADPGRINALVLLTDGEETDDTRPDAVAETMRAVASDPTRPTRLFAIAYSPDAGSEDGGYAKLDQIALSSGGYAYDARDPSTLRKVFNDVISNF
ncbi:vWA domain-containing protein [Actinomycetospora termitidis]|uniref:Substrate-binding domain-containing protein n=1 Tax=Actinomycetospora termitidis TaxID=3053470 RepID=A0ABT7MBQ0_9PSEU|nr:substrate-binding domain-containing protein [Actinomycetospora sp. Odt1-22]MDL5158079.1 substrate-binding domain-containing protein [Actinomycetospora sp. Odt1-22]